MRWYDEYKRDLPWRRDADPYRIWISEIMLQQTRVAAVLDHYRRFMRRFPSLESLASAHEVSVLAAWSGLGYYHRARRLLQAAKIMARGQSGTFPQTSAEWLELPGIGRYTAAAIASIASGEAVPAVDGNVERVIQRLFGPMKSRDAAWHHAEILLDRDRPGDFNQAMMEVGATVCLPRAPHCPLCPVKSFCKSRAASPAQRHPERKSKEVHYGLVCDRSRVLLTRRSHDSSLMPDMWELPMIPSAVVTQGGPLLRVRHSITDTDYRVLVYAIAADDAHQRPGGQWFAYTQCERLPLTGLTRKILRRLRVESGSRAIVSK